MNTRQPINLTKTTDYNAPLLYQIRRERNNLHNTVYLPLYTVYEWQVSNLLPYLENLTPNNCGVFSLYKIHFKNYNCYLAVILDDTDTTADAIFKISIANLHAKRIAKANRQWANPDRNKTRGLANRDILNAVFASITDRIKKAGLGHLLFKGHSFGWTQSN